MHILSFLLRFIISFNNYFFSAYCVPDTGNPELKQSNMALSILGSLSLSMYIYAYIFEKCF